MRPAICSGGNPVYCQIAAMIGILISGKISTGVRDAARGPTMSRRSANTTKLYGRFNAMRTRAIMRRRFPDHQMRMCEWQLERLVFPPSVTIKLVDRSNNS